jgi:hypothetical protein
MSNYNVTANEIRLAKLELDVAEAKAKLAKDKYEALRKQLTADMIASDTFKFELFSSNGVPGMSFRLETKERWSPIVENKDILMDKLRQEAPDMFTVTPAALTKYIGELCEANDGELPKEFDGLVKKYDDTHVVVRETKR